MQKKENRAKKNWSKNRFVTIAFVIVIITGVSQLLRIGGTSLSHSDFYSELIDNPTLFSGIVHNGSTGALWTVTSFLSTESVVGLSQCLEKNKRIARGIGSSKRYKSKYIYVQLSSDKTVYELMIHWDKERSRAYVIQEERSTLRASMASLVVRPSEFGPLANDCLVDSILALELEKL